MTARSKLRESVVSTLTTDFTEDLDKLALRNKDNAFFQQKVNIIKKRVEIIANQVNSGLVCSRILADLLELTEVFSFNGNLIETAFQHDNEIDLLKHVSSKIAAAFETVCFNSWNLLPVEVDSKDNCVTGVDNSIVALKVEKLPEQPKASKFVKPQTKKPVVPFNPMKSCKPVESNISAESEDVFQFNRIANSISPAQQTVDKQKSLSTSSQLFSKAEFGSVSSPMGVSQSNVLTNAQSLISPQRASNLNPSTTDFVPSSKVNSPISSVSCSAPPSTTVQPSTTNFVAPAITASPLQQFLGSAPPATTVQIPIQHSGLGPTVVRNNLAPSWPHVLPPHLINPQLPPMMFPQTVTDNIESPDPPKSVIGRPKKVIAICDPNTGEEINPDVITDRRTSQCSVSEVTQPSDGDLRSRPNSAASFSKAKPPGFGSQTSQISGFSYEDSQQNKSCINKENKKQIENDSQFSGYGEFCDNIAKSGIGNLDLPFSESLNSVNGNFKDVSRFVQKFNETSVEMSTFIPVRPLPGVKINDNSFAYFQGRVASITKETNRVFIEFRTEPVGAGYSSAGDLKNDEDFLSYAKANLFTAARYCPPGWCDIGKSVLYYDPSKESYGRGLILRSSIAQSNNLNVPEIVSISILDLDSGDVLTSVAVQHASALTKFRDIPCLAIRCSFTLEPGAMAPQSGRSILFTIDTRSLYANIAPEIEIAQNARLKEYRSGILPIPIVILKQ